MRPGKMLWLVPVLTAALAAFSCNKNDNSSSTGSGGKSVGFSQEGSESDWRTAETRSMQETASQRGIDLKFLEAGGDQEKQIKQLRSFIAQRVGAIIMAPKVKTGYDSVLREAKAANIPVVLVDRGLDAPEDLYATLISSDFIDEGRRAAEWLAKHANGKANIVQLEGTAGSDPANDRKKGFMEVLAKYPDMKVAASQDGDFEVSKGKQVMAAFLKSVPNITAVYAHNDNMALGAIQAIEEDGRFKPGKDIVIVSIDGIKGALQAIVDGKLNCSVECNPLLGPAAFDSIDNVRAGRTVSKHQIQKDELFDSGNVTPELLKQRKY